MEFLAITAWIAFAAFLISKVFFATREGIATDFLFAAAAITMGFVVWLAYGLVGLEIYSIVAAITGGVLLMVGYHAIRVRRPSEFRGRLVYAGRSREKRRLLELQQAIPLSRLKMHSLTGTPGSSRSRIVDDEISTWEGEGGSSLPPIFGR